MCQEIQSVSLIPPHNLLVNFIRNVNYYHLIIANCIVSIFFTNGPPYLTQPDILQNHFDIVIDNIGHF